MTIKPVPVKFVIHIAPRDELGAKIDGFNPIPARVETAYDAESAFYIEKVNGRRDYRLGKYRIIKNSDGSYSLVNEHNCVVNDLFRVPCRLSDMKFFARLLIAAGNGASDWWKTMTLIDDLVKHTKFDEPKTENRIPVDRCGILLDGIDFVNAPYLSDAEVSHDVRWCLSRAVLEDATQRYIAYETKYFKTPESVIRAAQKESGKRDLGPSNFVGFWSRHEFDVAYIVFDDTPVNALTIFFAEPYQAASFHTFHDHQYPI